LRHRGGAIARRGAVNAAYALNSVVHNTAWVAAHFHLTVGSAAALTFMGACYWLVPKVSGRELELKLLAKVQPYLWFIGMALFSFTGHIAGLLGLPRRVFTTGYGLRNAANAILDGRVSRPKSVSTAAAEASPFPKSHRPARRIRRASLSTRSIVTWFMPRA
jgi:hypothetical protein